MNILFRQPFTRRALLLAAVIASASTWPSLAQAQASAYPTHLIKLVVPFPPGGGTDIVGRVVAERLAEALGQAVVVDNRPGGGTTIGTALVANAPADGYTLLFTSSAFTVNPSLMPKVPYDIDKNFVPIANASFHPFVLLANPSLPVNTVQELITYAKANPDKLSYASVGNGSGQHIEMEMMKRALGINAVHIPYQGSAPAVTDLLGGQVQLMWNGISPTLGYIKSGRLKALAVDSDQRVPVLANVPTMAEAGVKGFKFVTWSGLMAPAGTPQPVVDRLTAEMQKITASKEFRERLAPLGLQAGGPAGAAYATFLHEDAVQWARYVKESGAKLD